MLAPVPRNLARWIWINEAKRSPAEEEIRKVIEQISSLSQEERGLLVGLFKASTYPFNKERDRRRYAEAFLQLLATTAVHTGTALSILQEWHDFILGKIDDMEFLKVAKFTMSDARDLLEKTQSRLTLEDKAFLAQIAEKCENAEERIRLQKIFVENAVKSQLVRSERLQAAFFEKYATQIEYTAPEELAIAAGTPVVSMAHQHTSLWWFVPKMFLFFIAILLIVPSFMLSLCQIAVGFHLKSAVDWFVPRWIQRGWQMGVPVDTIVPVMPTVVTDAKTPEALSAVSAVKKEVLESTLI